MWYWLYLSKWFMIISLWFIPPGLDSKRLLLHIINAIIQIGNDAKITKQKRRMSYFIGRLQKLVNSYIPYNTAYLYMFSIHHHMIVHLMNG